MNDIETLKHRCETAIALYTSDNLRVNWVWRITSYQYTEPEIRAMIKTVEAEQAKKTTPYTTKKDEIFGANDANPINTI